MKNRSRPKYQGNLIGKLCDVVERLPDQWFPLVVCYLAGVITALAIAIVVSFA